MMAVHPKSMLGMPLGDGKCFFECLSPTGEPPSPPWWVNTGKKPLRILNDPSEHNFRNYRCSVIMLMLIHKELLFAQRVLCTLSPYLTVFAQQLWFACHVKGCLHLWACQGTRRRAKVLVHPIRRFSGGLLNEKGRKGEQVKRQQEREPPFDWRGNYSSEVKKGAQGQSR